MAKQLRTMNVGERFIGNFYSSNGKSHDSLELEFMTRDESGETATLRDVEGGSEFKVYKFNGRWAYGSSADRFAVARAN